MWCAKRLSSFAESAKCAISGPLTAEIVNIKAHPDHMQRSVRVTRCAGTSSMRESVVHIGPLPLPLRELIGRADGWPKILPPSTWGGLATPN